MAPPSSDARASPCETVGGKRPSIAQRSPLWASDNLPQKADVEDATVSPGKAQCQRDPADRSGVASGPSHGTRKPSQARPQRPHGARNNIAYESSLFVRG